MYKNKNNLFAKCGNALTSLLKRKDPAELFVLLMSLSFIVYVITYLCIGNGRFSDMFFLRADDLFMDYFNSVRDAAQGPAVYTVRKVIYPPLANLIFLAISQFAPHGFNNTSFFYREDWVNYPSAILLFVIIVIICVIALFSVFRESINRKKLLSILFGFFAVFNSATLYMIERGNILVLCLLTLAVFAFTYNSESKAIREIGIIALAVSAALKLYPALFMWLFISDKRYKELARCLLYFAVLMIVPSFFFGGPECIITLLKNTFSFSSKKSSSSSAISVVAKFLHIPSSVLSIGAYLWCFLSLISFMASPFLKEERWKSVVKGVILMLTAPPLTSQYVWAFFLVPLVLLCNQKSEAERTDFKILIPMFVPFVFLLFRFNYYITINTLLVYSFTAILSAICLADTIKSFVEFRKNKRLKSN